MQGFYIDIFHTHKAGNSVSEYEDAFWPLEPTVKVREDNLRVAVADGATDAIHSGLWAQLLAEAYGKYRMTKESVQAQLAEASRIWDGTISKMSLPWYAEEKARSGAYAALIGLELTRHNDGDDGIWSALACGDSCLFHVRSDAVIKRFPVESSEEFSCSPLLLGSNPQTRGLEGIQTTVGSWEAGDCFYLMSDALAGWFLKRCETGQVPWEELRFVTLAQEPPFEEWIASLRRNREIKNDDCTLVAVSFEPCKDW